MRQISRTLWTIGLLALASLLAWNLLLSRGAQALQAIPPASTATSAALSLNQNISFVSQPRLSPAFLNQVLAAYHSPAAGLGQQIYDLGRHYDINSDLLLAIFGHESLFGTTGEARVSRSIGNLRCLDSSYAPYHPGCSDGYAQFPTWLDGVGASDRLLRVGYVDGAVTIPITGHRCTTLAQVIPVWAPAADGNNPGAYIRDVLAFLQTWYSGEVKP